MKSKVTWSPQAGSQRAFLCCPIFEVLYEGERGPGKTDALLMDFARDVGLGHGSEWKGVLFRQTYPQLQDVINKSKKWFWQIFPQAKFNEAKSEWRWPTGEQLLFRQFKKETDYWNYHGHAFPWIGWEELTTWPSDAGYLKMMSCCRTTAKGLPLRYRATTNTIGPGHNWVKSRWRLPGGRGTLITDAKARDGGIEPPRIAIHGKLVENRILLDADPKYIDRLRASASSEAELKSWMEGSWDIVSGGMFDDAWDANVHVVPNFPTSIIPTGWRVDRSYDWGSSRPFSVGWWAQSNGEPIKWAGVTIGAVSGDLIRIGEWYGYNGRRNEGLKMLDVDIAQGILDREADMGLTGRVSAGPADTSIWDDSNGTASSVASRMQSKGVTWEKADKGAGSRKQGWAAIRALLQGARQKPGQPRETKGLFVTQRCGQFLETFPVLPRSERDPDDVDTDAEDHIGDEVRYRVRRKDFSVRRSSF